MKKIILIILFFIASNYIIGQSLKVNYSADTSTIANPERGWYMSINPGFNDRIAPWLKLSSINQLRNSADKITLVRKYYLLKEYRNSAIPNWYLDSIAKDFVQCRLAGIKIIPRFSYLWLNGVGPDPDMDAPLNIVLQHLEQLKPLLENNADVIAWVQAGFVGKYGEWHTSSNKHVDGFTNSILPSGLKIRDKILEVVPPHLSVVMRYVEHHKIALWPTPLTQAMSKKSLPQARVGVHHDRVMFTSDWKAESCGVCPSVADMAKYIEEDTKWSVYEGEPESSGDYYMNDPKIDLAKVHISALANNANGDTHYKYWKSKGWYQQLTKMLGYRLVMESCLIDTVAEKGKNIKLNLELDNTGFAPPVNYKKFEIIFRNIETKKVYKIDVTHTKKYETDPRYWLPGRHSLNFEFALPNNANIGLYDVLISIADSNKTLYEKAEYSIRLANKDTWEASTGYNKLLAKVRLKDFPLNILDNTILNALSIYPNPATDKLYLNNLPSQSTITISDIAGKILINVNAQDASETIDISSLEAGVYLVKVGEITKKINVQ